MVGRIGPLLRGAVGATACLSLLSGCRSPVPFHAAHPARPGTPVLGLGGPAPYVSPAPGGPDAFAAPGTGAPVEVSHTTGSSTDIYAGTRPGLFNPLVRHLPARVYVPNSDGTTIDVISPRTFTVVRHISVGSRPQYIMPSWDLTTLWVNDSGGNDLVPIDSRTGRRGRAVPVAAAPTNVYFTPNGRYALVTMDKPARVEIRDPRSMRLRRSIPLPCHGVAHADFSADGSYLVVGCAMSGQLVRVDMRHGKVTHALRLSQHAMPQDIKVSPDGTLFYVADMANGGVWTIDARRFRRMGFIRTGKGAHGLVPSRDGAVLYVTNRDEGTVSLIDFTTRRVTRRWRLPGGGSPDMGSVSADGRVLWLSGRLHGVVYAIWTPTGRLIRTIPVGKGPHGVCVFPQPGRHSLGHTYR